MEPLKGKTYVSLEMGISPDCDASQEELAMFMPEFTALVERRVFTFEFLHYSRPIEKLVNDVFKNGVYV